MRRAHYVDELRRSTKDVDNKIDMLQWKVETLSQKDYTSDTIDGTDEKEPLDISQFLNDISKIKKEYISIKQDLKAVIDIQKESMNQLHERMYGINEKFSRIVELVGDH